VASVLNVPVVLRRKASKGSRAKGDNVRRAVKVKDRAKVSVRQRILS
jgi:hypothetical protein